MSNGCQDVDRFIRSLSLFASLPAEAVARLRPFILEQTYGPGQIIFHEGDAGDAVYFVSRGRVRVFKTSPAGDEMILGIMRTGDLFGGLVLFGRKNYPATAQAMEESVVASILTRRFHQVMVETPALGAAVSQLIAERLEGFQRRLAHQGTRDARYRLLAALCELAAEHGQDGSKKDTVLLPLDLTHQELAAMIGTTRETVSRLLGQLRQDGVVSQHGDYVEIFTGALDDMV